MGNFIKCWRRLCHYWRATEQVGPMRDYSEERLLWGAAEELSNAHNLFSRVQDHEMVEYAILILKAAEIRYDYLLKKVKACHNVKGHTLDGEVDLVLNPKIKSIVDIPS